MHLSLLALIPMTLAATAWAGSRHLAKNAAQPPAASALWQKLEAICAAIVALSHVEISWRYRSTAEWTASPIHWWVLIAQSAMVLWIMLHGMRAAQMAMQPLNAPAPDRYRCFLSAALRCAAAYWLLVSALFLLMGLVNGASTIHTNESALPSALSWLIPGLAEAQNAFNTPTMGLMTAYSLWPIPVISIGYLLVPAVWAMREPTKLSLAAALPCLALAAVFIKTSPTLALLAVALGGLTQIKVDFKFSLRLNLRTAAKAITSTILIVFLFFQKEIYNPFSFFIISLLLIIIKNPLQPQSKSKEIKISHGSMVILFHGFILFLILQSKYYNN